MVTDFIRRALSSIGDAVRLGQHAPGGRDYVTAPAYDSFRTYVSDQLNPSKLKNLLRAGNSGDLSTTLRLFEEMEDMDANLRGLANTRRGALTGLDWSVESVASKRKLTLDDKLATEAKSFIEQSFSELGCFDEALEHLSTAIGPNLAVLELVWEGDRLADLVPIPSHRLRVDMQEPELVRIVTASNQIGVPAVSPKFVVHVPHPRAAFPFSGTMCHAQAMIYLTKILAVADWASYVELFGQPVRWAEWSPTATTEEKQNILDMLKNMGSAAYGGFPKGTSLQMVEASQRSQSPHKDIIEWCGREQAKLWLGGNLVSDTSGGTGTFAAATVQNEVRGDLLQDDARREARTIREQIIAPMMAFRFASANTFDRRRALPEFRRDIPEADTRANDLDVIIKHQQAGGQVTQEYLHDVSGVPVPDSGEEIVQPSLDMFGAALTEDVNGP